MADDYAKFFKRARAAAEGKNEAIDRAFAGDRGAKVVRPTKRITPEQSLQQELARRANVRRLARRNRSRPFPKGPAVCAAVTLVIASIGYWRPDLADAAMSSVSGILGRYEFSVFGAASASGDTSSKGGEKSADPAKSESNKNHGTSGGSDSADAAHLGGEKAAASNAPGSASASASEGQLAASESSAPKSLTAEEISVYAKLSERKKKLDQREGELNKLEEELQKQKSELEKKLGQLETTRREIASTLKTRVEADQEKVDKLVQVYSSMKPQQAAKVIGDLNEDLAVEVLGKMKKDKAAEVMNVMDAKKAEKLSEILAGYKRAG